MQRASGKGTMKDATRRANTANPPAYRGSNMANQDQHIRCGTCGLNLNRCRFSQTALRRYQEASSRAKGRRLNDSNIRLPNCVGCTGGNRNEMFCHGSCQKYYSLDKFFKAQRQNTDNAKCKNCAQEAEDRVADVKDAIEEQKILDQLENPSMTTGPWGTTALRGSLPSTGPGTGLSAPASNTGRTASTADSGQVWIQPDRSYVGRNGRSTDGTNNAHDDDNESDSESVQTQSTVYGAQSTAGVRSNVGWDNSTPIERAYPAGRRAPSNTSTNGGFVKQGAVRQTAEQRAREQHQREQAKKAQAEEDDEDDEDADSDNDSDDPY